jgi:hypothetical protein
MAPRNKRCRNCPKPPKQETPAVIVVTSEDESKHIWDNIQAATALSIGLMEGYVQLGLPGKSSEAIMALRDRLETLIES